MALLDIVGSELSTKQNRGNVGIVSDIVSINVKQTRGNIGTVKDIVPYSLKVNRGNTGVLKGIVIETLLTENSPVMSVADIQSTQQKNLSSISAKAIVNVGGAAVGFIETIQAKGLSNISGSVVSAAVTGNINATQNKNTSVIVAKSIINVGGAAVGFIETIQEKGLSNIVGHVISSASTGALASTNRNNIAIQAKAINKGISSRTQTLSVSSIIAKAVSKAVLSRTQNLNTLSISATTTSAARVANLNSVNYNLSILQSKVVSHATVSRAQFTNTSLITLKAINKSSLNRINSNTFSITSKVISHSVLSRTQEINTASIIAKLILASRIGSISSSQNVNTDLFVAKNIVTAVRGALTQPVNTTVIISKNITHSILADINKNNSSVTGKVITHGNISRVQQINIATLMGILYLEVRHALLTVSSNKGLSGFSSKNITHSNMQVKNINLLSIVAKVVTQSVMAAYGIKGASDIDAALIHQISNDIAVMIKEIWQRLELDKDKPVAITESDLKFGEITQMLFETGSYRIGASEIADNKSEQRVLEIWQRLGLDPLNSLSQSDTNIHVGNIDIEISGTSPMIFRRL